MSRCIKNFALFLCIICCFFVCEKLFAFSLSSLSPVSLLGSAANLFKSDKKFELEEVKFSIAEDTNHKGALKLHLVIAFDKEALNQLKKIKAREYFERAEQFKKDYPDKIKIFQWTIVAKKRLTDWKKIEYDSDFMNVEGGLVFARYDDSSGPQREHRATIPAACKKMKIILECDDFKLEPEKEEDEDKEDNEEEEGENEDEKDDGKNPFDEDQLNHAKNLLSGGGLGGEQGSNSGGGFEEVGGGNSGGGAGGDSGGGSSDQSQFNPEELKADLESGNDLIPQELGTNMQWH